MTGVWAREGPRHLNESLVVARRVLRTLDPPSFGLGHRPLRVPVVVRSARRDGSKESAALGARSGQRANLEPGGSLPPQVATSRKPIRLRYSPLALYRCHPPLGKVGGRSARHASCGMRGGRDGQRHGPPCPGPIWATGYASSRRMQADRLVTIAVEVAMRSTVSSWPALADREQEDGSHGT